MAPLCFLGSIENNPCNGAKRYGAFGRPEPGGEPWPEYCSDGSRRISLIRWGNMETSAVPCRLHSPPDGCGGAGGIWVSGRRGNFDRGIFFASNVIVSLVIIGIWFHAARQEIQQGTVRKGNFLLIIPFISIGIYYILFEAAISAGIHDRKMLARLIIAAVMILAALLTVYLLYARLAKEYQILKNNQMYLKQMKAYELYFSTKENDDQELIRMRHDLKQMLLLMRSQILNKEYGEMEKLVNGLIGSTFSLARIKHNTGNPALDAHLNKLETVAAEKGITAYIGTDVPGKMNFTVEDLSILFRERNRQCRRSIGEDTGRKQKNLG